MSLHLNGNIIGDMYVGGTKVGECLGWKVKFSLEDMCKDSWIFQQKIY